MKLEEKMGRDMENRQKWEKTNLWAATLKLNYATESDVIEHLKKQKNRRQYLIELIREDIKKEA